MARNRVLVVSARCGRVVWRYVLRGLMEAGKSMAPYGPGAIAELYEPGYEGHHPDRWTARLTLRERRLWRALEHRLRRPDGAPATTASPPTRSALPAAQPSAGTRPSVPRPAAGPPAGPLGLGSLPAGAPAAPETGWQAAGDQHQPPR